VIGENMGNEIRTMFETKGPYTLPVGKKRWMTPDEIDSFWNGIPEIADKIGCYIFAVRASRGFTPYYVGKTTKSFRNEALSSRNQTEFIQPTLYDRAGGAVLFLLTLPTNKGPKNKKHIKELELFLIQQASLVNEDLKNTHGTKPPDWGIRGVYRGGQGNRAQNAKELMICLGLDISD
jgi:hypothetical protein